MEPALDPQQQADNDALASAVGAAAHQLGLDDHAHAHAHSHPHSIPHSVAHSQTHSHVGTPTQADEDNAFLAHQLQQPEYGGSGVGHGHGHGHGKEGSAGIGVGVGVGVGVGLADDSGQHGHVDLDLANIDLPLEHNLAHGQQQHAHMNQSFHIPSPPMMHQHHNQHQQQHQQLQHDQPTQSTFVRPPSIRKACDLCHAAKQKCSGDRPTCTRCLAGGWQCHYAPRQRRRTVPKESRSLGLGHGHHLHGHGHSHGGHNTGHGSGTDGEAMSPGAMGSSATAAKKRKLEVRRNSLTFENGLDLKTAMGMALDMGMANEDEGEEILNMSNEAMLEVIAVDGYIADLPLATFVNNLPYTAPPAPPQLPSSGPPSASASASATHPPIGVGVGVGLGGGGGNGNGGVDDYGADSFQGADMDQHTTSALRDAIFSLNNDGVGVGVGVGVGMDSGGNDNGVGNGDGVSVGLDDGTDIDPHLALLDLSHIAEDGEGLDGLGLGGEHGQNDHSHGHGHAHGETDHAELLSMHLGCNHPEMVPHLLALLVQHPLDPKPHANTPLTMPILAPLARAIRTFHNIANCPACMSSPQQTLPQLALISRLSTILTFPFPPTNSGQIPGAQIVLHGARLTGTGISDSIEQHIVHVVWDSWRASIREVFMIFERQARDVIASSAAAARDKEDKKRADGGDAQDREQQGYPKPIVSSVEIQRAGLFFQAMSRLKQAMEEVEME